MYSHKTGFLTEKVIYFRAQVLSFFLIWFNIFFFVVEEQNKKKMTELKTKKHTSGAGKE